MVSYSDEELEQFKDEFQDARCKAKSFIGHRHKSGGGYLISGMIVGGLFVAWLPRLESLGVFAILVVGLIGFGVWSVYNSMEEIEMKEHNSKLRRLTLVFLEQSLIDNGVSDKVRNSGSLAERIVKVNGVFPLL